MPRLCDFETCRKQASYGEFYGKPLRCNHHKEEYRLVSQLCKNVDCKQRASYNLESESNALYCAIHKLEGMVDKIHKSCIYSGCKKIPGFNIEGETKALYCATHKLDGMINVVNKKICIHLGCIKLAGFNVEEELNPLYCVTHKLDGMVNIKNKTCNFKGCKVQPTFNVEGQPKALYCATHKLDGMIDIISKTCIYPSCKKHPAYNVEGETKRLYCVTHKLDGMVNIKNKTCSCKGCKVQPNYNFKGELQAKFCNSHKEEGMIDVKSKKCKANYCLGTSANPKYKGYCSSCYQNLFPIDPLSLQMRSKTKEIAVRDFINIIFEGFQHDTPLWTGNCDCTHRRRIDHRKLIGNTLLCVETDEKQHKNYDEKDEEIRYDDLFMLHSGKFIYIRFNPDKFKNKDGKSLNPTLYTRLPILKEEIEKQIERIKNEENIELLEIIKLYYNE